MKLDFDRIREKLSEVDAVFFQYSADNYVQLKDQYLKQGNKL